MSKFQSNPLSKVPASPNETLSISISLGAKGDGKAEAKGLPIHRTGTPNGLPPFPGRIALAGLK